MMISVTVTPQGCFSADILVSGAPVAVSGLVCRRRGLVVEHSTAPPETVPAPLLEELARRILQAVA